MIVLQGNYDDSVRHAFEVAAREGWFVVQDTATADYREIPADITCGYGVIASEVIEQIETPPTHVIVQAGVGGVASAICARFWQAWGAARPRFIVLEPGNAAAEVDLDGGAERDLRHDDGGAGRRVLRFACFCA